MVTATEEFPGIPSTSPSEASASKASTTTLSNGLTVVSETASSTSTISLTFPGAGSSSESSSESGAALANKFLSFKSGSGLSSAVILRNLENDGASTFTAVDKSSATVGYTASKEKALRLIPLLATTSSFEKWDVKDVQKSASIASEVAASDALSALSDSVFAASYGDQSAFGKSLYGSSATAAGIESFRTKAYVLNGAVLAATGIEDHESFVKAVEMGFSESAVGDTPASAVDSTFIGGESRIYSPSVGAAHITLAFQGPKGSKPLMDIIEHCINLSSSDAVSGYTSPSTGLVGLYTSSLDGSSATDELCTVATSIPSAEIVARAKALAKSAALFSVDGADSKTLASAMAGSVLELGSVGYADVAAAYDGVTVDQVQAAFTAMGSSVPSMASVGDLSTVPYQGSIAGRFS